MRLTSAPKHQSCRSPRRQGRLVISDLTQWLPGLSDSLFRKELGYIVQVAAAKLVRWSLSYFIDTLWWKYSWLQSSTIRKRNARDCDVVSFLHCESYSYLKTLRAQRWFSHISGYFPFQEPQEPVERVEVQCFSEALYTAPKSAKRLLWRNEQWFESSLSGVGNM